MDIKNVEIPKRYKSVRFIDVIWEEEGHVSQQESFEITDIYYMEEEGLWVIENDDGLIFNTREVEFIPYPDKEE